MDFSSLDYRMISTVASVIMTLAWVAYLHLALTQYMRSNRPYLVIQHAHENDPSALCTLVNLSKEPVHLQAVIARIHRGNECNSYRITNYERIISTEQQVQSKLRQGPIQPGEYLVLGSFADIMLGKQSADEDTATQCGTGSTQGSPPGKRRTMRTKVKVSRSHPSMSKLKSGVSGTPSDFLLRIRRRFLQTRRTPEYAREKSHQSCF